MSVRIADQSLSRFSGKVPRAQSLTFERFKTGCPVVVAFVALAALNFTPLLKTVGAPLAVVAAVVSVFQPYAAFLFVAASQISPDPPDFPLTLAQLFVVAWVVTLPINSCVQGAAAIFNGLRYVSVFILFWCGLSLINQTFNEAQAYAFATAAILCTYLPRARGNYVALLWMLALGGGLGILGHWGTAFGLPMEGKIYEHAVRGGIRMGSGRADVNFTSVNIGFALWTTVALLLPMVWLGSVPQRLRSTLMALAALTLCAVPLIAMGSRGGLTYLVVGGAALGLYSFTVRAFAGAARLWAITGAVTMTVATPLIWPYFLQSTTGQMLLSTLQYNQAQATLTGSGGAAAGRLEIWGKFFNIAMHHPWFGAPKGAVVDMGEYGYAILGVEGGAGGTGHNFFLDLAAGYGFPVAIIFVVAFFAPIICLIRRRGKLYALPFVAAHIMVLLPFLNLSILNWKTYWALHIITAAAATLKRPSAHIARWSA